MKQMGCFNDYIDKQRIVLFGGGAATSPSFKSFQVDLTSLKITRKAKDELAKSDRFQNHIYFKKDDSLFVFGEHFLHTFDLGLKKWSEDEIFALNQAS